MSVEGVLRTRSYDNPQGQRVYVTEVIVTSFVNLTKRDDNQGQGMEQNQGFGNGNDAFGGGFPIPDDDLPF